MTASFREKLAIGSIVTALGSTGTLAEDNVTFNDVDDDKQTYGFIVTGGVQNQDHSILGGRDNGYLGVYAYKEVDALRFDFAINDSDISNRYLRKNAPVEELIVSYSGDHFGITTGLFPLRHPLDPGHNYEMSDSSLSRYAFDNLEIEDQIGLSVSAHIPIGESNWKWNSFASASKSYWSVFGEEKAEILNSSPNRERLLGGGFDVNMDLFSPENLKNSLDVQADNLLSQLDDINIEDLIVRGEGGVSFDFQQLDFEISKDAQKLLILYAQQNIDRLEAEVHKAIPYADVARNVNRVIEDLQGEDFSEDAESLKDKVLDAIDFRLSEHENAVLSSGLDRIIDGAEDVDDVVAKLEKVTGGQLKGEVVDAFVRLQDAFDREVIGNDAYYDTYRKLVTEVENAHESYRGGNNVYSLGSEVAYDGDHHDFTLGVYYNKSSFSAQDLVSEECAGIYSKYNYQANKFGYESTMILEKCENPYGVMDEDAENGTVFLSNGVRYDFQKVTLFGNVGVFANGADGAKAVAEVGAHGCIDEKLCLSGAYSYGENYDLISMSRFDFGQGKEEAFELRARYEF